MSNDAAEDPAQQPTGQQPTAQQSTGEQSTGERPEQHGPEMDDDQVAATNDLDDRLPPVDPERQA